MIDVLSWTSETIQTITNSPAYLQELGDASTDPLEIADADLSSLGGYDGLIVGAPTWNTGADTERSGTGWDNLLDDIRGKQTLPG